MNKTILKALILINPIIIWVIGNMLIMFVMQTIMGPPDFTPFENGQPSGFTVEYSATPIYGYVILCGGIYLSIKLWIKHIENHE